MTCCQWRTRSSIAGLVQGHELAGIRVQALDLGFSLEGWEC